MAQGHSAAGSAAGYLHQIQLGLVLLWQRAPSEPDVAITLEALDDLVLSDGHEPVVLVQAKHSVNSGSLSDRSVAVWKTLGIWMKLLGDEEPLPRLVLCATQEAAAQSAMSFLTSDPEKRDEVEALKCLTEVAAERGGNAATSTWRADFVALEPTEQQRLVAAIDVLDGVARADDFDRVLREDLIGMHAPDPESVDEFADRVYRWWMGRAAFMLTGRLDRVTGRELWALVREVHDLVTRRTLTVDTEILEREPDDAEHLSLRERTFIKQLRLVTDADELLNLAVHDYWRAREQRGRWDREGRVMPGELSTYDRRLRDEWKAASALMKARLDGREHTEAERRAAGLDLYGDLPQRSTVRVRVDFHEPVITRGSLHALSDGQEIGWHPDFRNLLDS